jgi:hypothetical protein
VGVRVGRGGGGGWYAYSSPPHPTAPPCCRLCLLPACAAALLPLQPGPDAGPNPNDYVGAYDCSKLEGIGSVSYGPPPNATSAALQAQPTLRFNSVLTHTMTLSAVPGRQDTFFAWLDPGSPGQPCSVMFGGAPDAYIVFARSGGGAGRGRGGNVTGFAMQFTYPGVAWTRV